MDKHSPPSTTLADQPWTARPTHDTAYTTYTDAKRTKFSTRSSRATHDTSLSIIKNVMATTNADKFVKVARMEEQAKHAILLANRMCTRSVPWLNDEHEEIWGKTRISIAKVVISKPTEIFLACVIVFNLCLIIYETNEEAKCYPEYRHNPQECPTNGRNSSTLEKLNIALLTMYSIEAIFNMYVFRLEYFKRKSRLFDFAICVGGWWTIAIASFVNISWIRILRCTRVLRTLRFVYSIPEVYMLFAGFMGSMKAMFFGAIVLIALLGIASILIVQIVHPVNASIHYPDCEHCSEGFRSIGESMFTLFQQIVAGDSWGLISVPVVKEDFWVGMILPITQLVIGVGAMNLILAVVVDRAVEAREDNREQVASMRADERKARKLEWLQVFRRCDADNSGTITREELLDATVSCKDLIQRLQLMGVREEEVLEIFDALENDCGDVGYTEVCDVFDDIQAADVRKIAVLTKLRIESMEDRIHEHLVKHDHILDALSQQLAGATHLRDLFPNGNFEIQRPSMQQQDGSKTSHAKFGNETKQSGSSATLGTVNKQLASLPSRNHRSTSSIDNALHSSRHQECELMYEPRASTPMANVQSGIPASSPPSDSRCKDTANTCKTQIANDISLLNRIVAQLDESWSEALRMSHGASLMCTDPSMSESNVARTVLSIDNHVLARLGHRRSRLIQELAKDLEDDAVLLLKQCTSASLHNRDGADIPADDHQRPTIPQKQLDCALAVESNENK